MTAENPTSSPRVLEAIVDTHVHVWDPVKIPRSWLVDVPSLDRQCSIEEYEAEARPLGVEGGVYVETVVDEPFLGAELEGVVALLDGDSMIQSAVVGGRPGRPGFVEWTQRVAEDSRISGVRCVLHPEGESADAPAAPEFIADLRRLGERGLHFELCIRPDQLAAASELVAACPGTRFVLDHLGRPRVAEGLDDAWSDALKRLAEFESIDVKLSALIECAEGAVWTPATFEPFLGVAVEAFGPSRTIWGGNWPVCSMNGSLTRWVDATRGFLASYPPDDRAAILSGTANRVYGLS